MQFRTREDWQSYMLDAGRYPAGATAEEYLLQMGMTRKEQSFQGAKPRHLEAYRFLQHHYPHFEWKVLPNGSVSITRYPTVNGVTPSLADLVANIKRQQEGQPPLFTVDVLSYKGQKRLAPLVRDGGLAQELAKVIDNRCVLPEFQVVPAITRWCANAVATGNATIMTVVCPDYEVVNGRYTFKSLRYGIGLVAQRAVELFPILLSVLKAHNITANFVVAMGDDEADDPTIVNGMGETRESFRAKMRISQARLQEAFPAEMNVQTPFLTEMNTDLWHAGLREAEHAAQRGQFFGPLRIDGAKREWLIASRRSLYTRWYGPHVNVAQKFAEQAVSYMASGQVVQRLPNCLYIGFDSPAMALCMHGLARQPLPVLSVRSADY